MKAYLRWQYTFNNPYCATKGERKKSNDYLDANKEDSDYQIEQDVMSW